MKGIAMTARFTVLALTVAILASVPTTAEAQAACSKYYGQGYCTDYVQQRVGARQRGDAKVWKCNVAMINVRRGDVAVFKGLNHVAVVEDVIVDAKGVPRRVRISEWNFGRVAPGDSEKRMCIITNKFGIRTERTVLTASASCYWRP